MPPANGTSTLFRANLTGILDLASSASMSETQLRQQWLHPSDILSSLLLLGPEVVQKALAQLSGAPIVPVAFSFGWVAYAMTALRSVFGDDRLMPKTDDQILMVSADSGHAVLNNSWIVERAFKFCEQAEAPMCRDKSSDKWEALRVSVYRPSSKVEPGCPEIDWLWFSGLVVIGIQFVIAAIPFILYQEWIVPAIFTIGTMLSLIQGSLPQWRREKWACPTGSCQTICMTRGNGGRNAFVIAGTDNGLELGILATGHQRVKVSQVGKLSMTLLAILWTLLLFTVAGLKQGSWFVLAIGLIGTVQNLMAANATRSPSAYGIHLEFAVTLSDKKVSKVLVKAEGMFPGVGIALLPVFFPAGFRVPEDEKQFWLDARKAQEERLGTIVSSDISG